MYIKLKRRLRAPRKKVNKPHIPFAPEEPLTSTHKRPTHHSDKTCTSCRPVFRFVLLSYSSYCFKLWGHSLIDLSFVYCANRKLCLESYRLSQHLTRSPFLECKKIQQGTPKRCEIIYFIKKFPYNARSDWLKQRTFSENRERVNDIKLAFKFLLPIRQNQYKRAIFQQ